MNYTKDGFNSETGVSIGPYAEANTKIGTDRSHIGIGVRAGGASIEGTRHGLVDWNKETVTMGGCNEITLIGGGKICVSQEIHNPLGKEKREKYWDGITSGDPMTMGKTAMNGAKEMWDLANNPHIIASEMLGWKPKTNTEKFIANIPGVNMAAGIGRSWGLW